MFNGQLIRGDIWLEARGSEGGSNFLSASDSGAHREKPKAPATCAPYGAGTKTSIQIETQTEARTLTHSRSDTNRSLL